MEIYCLHKMGHQENEAPVQCDVIKCNNCRVINNTDPTLKMSVDMAAWLQICLIVNKNMHFCLEAQK